MSSSSDADDGAGNTSTGLDETAGTGVSGSTSGMPASDDTTTSTTGDGCNDFFDDDSDALGAVSVHASSVNDVPFWLAVHEAGCYDSPLLLSGPGGTQLDVTPPSCHTCQYAGAGDAGCPGVICQDERLVLVEPGSVALDAVWPGEIFETHVLPDGCPDAGEPCERRAVAEPGRYEVTVWISESATCGGEPCVCDGQSDPCVIGDPTAMLVDPQEVTVAFDFPEDAEVQLDLALR